MTCPSCGAANPPAAKFCVECGTRFAAACPSCGTTTNPPSARFCAECGARLASDAPGGGAAAAMHASAVLAEPRSSRAVEPQTERRLVSVLFADLVGFTTRSETADPEQVREFQARYFEVAREVIERYGGTVEKFIGDAVMAVWGTPIAREDDAERAVRAALDLVDTIGHLGRQAHDGELQLRAGVLTGEAAVAIGAVGQGMVSGDLVNTASRLQSVAPPGTVLVGEATKRAASSAIVFEAAGEQLLKGKTAPVEAWRALRVVAERGGLGRSEGIEAPFVGRDDELRLIKDFLHATSKERRVRLLSVTGQAGIGKSRLAWEFLKYIDGVSEDIYWHQGRSPSFGEGVTFWALGEMVRRRAGLAEGDDPATTTERVIATVAEYVADESERRRIEPALLSLLGVGEAPAGGREELFAAWRTFFERIALRGTTVLVFEDLQWADQGLLDFIDHLLEWSIGYPILVITLARPDLLERHPGWGAGRRNFVALALGPLSDDAMRQLLEGLVPGLPATTVQAILARADGIPLYAVETIRMLVEDGRLEESDGVYRVTGDLGSLDIPDTLHALIAARLDAVDPSDRALLQDGAVLGQSFSVTALSALVGQPADVLEPRLRSLVQRELLQLDTDPRSPERGQFGFTQALVREVAYATLAKRDRRAKHLAAARYFESLGDEETAGVLATHYVDAYLAAPEGPEGEAVATQARIALRAAADRATALGAHEGAIAFWERARSVTTDPVEEADLLYRIGQAARSRGRFVAAEEAFRDAQVRFQACGDRLGEARAAIGLARVFASSGRVGEAIAVAEEASASIEDLAPNADLVEGWLSLSSAHATMSRPASSLEFADRALADAERLGLMVQVMDGMRQKGSAYLLSGRPVEGRSLVSAALALGEKIGLGEATTRAAFTLALASYDDDPRAAVELGKRTVELCRRYGMASMLRGALMNTVEVSLSVGDWAWLERELEDIRDEELEPADRATIAVARAELGSMRGHDVDADVQLVRDFAAGMDDTTSAAGVAIAYALVAFAESRFEDAIAAARQARSDPLNAPVAGILEVRSSIRLRDGARAREALSRLDATAWRGAAVEVARNGLAAAVAALEGDWPEAVAGFMEAWRRHRELGLDVGLATSQLDCLAVAPMGDPLARVAATEARTILEREGAVAYLRQLEELLAERQDLGTLDRAVVANRPVAPGSDRLPASDR